MNATHQMPGRNSRTRSAWILIAAMVVALLLMAIAAIVRSVQSNDLPVNRPGLPVPAEPGTPATPLPP